MNLKEALQYLVSLKDNKTYEINGETYSDHDLHRIAPHVDRPDEVMVNGLDSVVKLVKNELDILEDTLPVYIRVVDPNAVRVFTSLDAYMGRDKLYACACDAPTFKPGWYDQEETIILLKSIFIPNEGTEYLLDLLSRISKEDSVTSEDNGVSQTVSARQGVSLKQYEAVKPRIKLAPFRTFMEVEQPESEFILRLDNEGRVGILEADGGRWKMDAKRNIARYFEEALSEQISSGHVVVMV